MSEILTQVIVLYFNEGDDVVIAHLFHQSQDYASIVLNGKNSNPWRATLREPIPAGSISSAGLSMRWSTSRWKWAGSTTKALWRRSACGFITRTSRGSKQWRYWCCFHRKGHSLLRVKVLSRTTPAWLNSHANRRLYRSSNQPALENIKYIQFFNALLLKLISANETLVS